MSIYVIMPIVFIIGSFFFLYFKIDIEAIVFFVAFMLLACLSALRYAQAADYYNYRFNYYNSVIIYESIEDLLFVKKGGLQHGQIGWQALSYYLVSKGVAYEYLVAAVSIVSCLFLYNFICLYCSKGRFIAILILYPVAILVYFFSGIRQGLVMSVFLGALVPMLEKHKYISFCIVAFLCSLIHSLSLISLICIHAVLIKRRKIELICIVCTAVGAMSALLNIYDFLGKLPQSRLIGQIIIHAKNRYAPSRMAILLRIVILIAVVYAYYHTEEKYRHEWLYKCFMIGMCIYMLSSSNSLISSRLFEIFRYLDIPVLIIYLYTKKRSYVFFIYAFSMFLTVRNLNEFQKQIGGYTNTYRFYEIPYYSIFDKESAEEDIPDRLYGDRYLRDEKGNITEIKQ